MENGSSCSKYLHVLMILFYMYIRNCTSKDKKGIEIIVLIKVSTASVFRLPAT